MAGTSDSEVRSEDADVEHHDRVDESGDGSTSDEQVHTVVLGINHPQQAAVMRQEIERHPRFDVVREAPNAIMTHDVAIQVQPEVIIFSDASPGTPGRAVLADLKKDVPGVKVIITVTEDPDAVLDAGPADAAVNEYDPVAMQRALDSTAEALSSAEEQLDRRKSMDRRMKQDWSVVFAERRISVRRSDET